MEGVEGGEGSSISEDGGPAGISAAHAKIRAEPQADD